MSDSAQDASEMHDRGVVDLLGEWYQALFNAANDAIFIHDLQGRFLDVNDLACRRLGYSREELLSMSVRDIDAPPLAAAYDEKMEAFVRLGSAVIETKHRSKQGQILSIELSSRVVHLGDRTLVMSVARDVTERERRQAELLAVKEKIAALNAIIAERDRISREMHDSLAQVLAFVRYRAHSLAEALQRGEIGVVAAGLDQIENGAASAYADVRASIMDLRTVIAEGSGVIAVLKDYALRFEQEWGIKTDVVLAEDIQQYPHTTEIQLLRIIQEAMTNLRKHARATHAWIRFERRGQQTVVTIEDDGIGFDVSAVQASHFGLAIMRERAQEANAVLTITSEVGHGTTVSVALPPPDVAEDRRTHGAD